LVDQSQLLGLLQIDRIAESGAQLFERAPQRRLQFLGADALVADRGDCRDAGDEQALRHARQEVLEAHRTRIDVRERLVALVDRQREEREHARRTARCDRDQ